MTDAQLSKQNKENASHSTGPKSIEGKLNSRRNALKHGMTAKVVTLPDENLVDIQASADAWLDACRPETHDEEILVDLLALTSLRLERCAKVEAEILSEQIRGAEEQWDLAKENKLDDLTRLYQENSVKAVIELKHFGKGVHWLLERWFELKVAFVTFHCLSNLTLIKDFIKLCGHDSDKLEHASIAACELAFFAVACIPGNEENKMLQDYLESQVSGRWLGNFSTQDEFSREEAVEAIGARIKKEIDDLKKRAVALDACDKASREGARVRALCPSDTTANRRFLRYMKSNESGFDRTLKTLSKLQKERKKVTEKEAREASKPTAQNEPKVTVRSNSKQVHTRSCVISNGIDHVVEDRDDGRIMCAPLDPSLAPAVFGEASPRKTAA